MLPTLGLRSLNRLCLVVPMGLILFTTGCAPRIPTTSEEDVDPIDRSSLHPLTGCYNYKGPRVNWNCSNCGSEPFFPFPAGVDGSPGEPSYLENGSDERPEPDAICLQDDGENRLLAVSYRKGEPIAKKRYEGRIREDGYFVLDDYTEVNFTPIIVVWGPTHGRAALAVDSSGNLKTIEVRKSGAFLVFMPLGGATVETIHKFKEVTGSRVPLESKQSDS